MTVGELREFLAGVPDDAMVYIPVSTVAGMWEPLVTGCISQPTTATEVFLR